MDCSFVGHEITTMTWLGERTVIIGYEKERECDGMRLKCKPKTRRSGEVFAIPLCLQVEEEQLWKTFTQSLNYPSTNQDSYIHMCTLADVCYN
jgi:hypothetical protein